MCLLALPGHAQTDDTEALLKLQLTAYELESAISYYSLQNGDLRAAEWLNRVLVLGNSLSERLGAQQADIKAAWYRSAEFINLRKASAASGEDVNFPRHFDEVKLPLYNLLETRLAAVDLSSLGAEKVQIYAALLSLEKITSSYLFFNISFFGGLSLSDIGIAEENERFKIQLERLIKHHPQAKQAERKWHFLEKTILAYNEQSAVFIVVKTTDKIRLLLAAGLSS